MISLARHDLTDDERILVVGTRYLGDTLLAVPFLRNLRRRFPDAVIDFCAEAGARAVLATCPHVDGFVNFRRPRSAVARAAAVLGDAARLRERRYAKAYLLKRSLSAAALAALAGVPQRVGFEGDGSLLLTRRVRRDPGRHQADAYLDLLRGEGVRVDDGRLENWVAPEAAARVESLLRRLPPNRPRVFLALRSTDEVKHWPLERWQRLVTHLVADRGCDVVLCGSPADAAAHGRLRGTLSSDVAVHLHDLSAAVPLADAAALLARVDLCVGIDTGLVHMAASLGVPVAVLFGPTDPARWAPRSTRSIVLRSSAPAVLAGSRPATMEEIAFADVAAAVATLLPQAAPSRTIRTLDLREGSFRYEVVAGPASGSAQAVEPAVPLAAG